MSSHRNDKNINELKKYFNSVIDWVSSVFIDVESEMQGIEWGRLYETYHKKSYNPKKVSEEVQKLYEICRATHEGEGYDLINPHTHKATDKLNAKKAIILKP